MNKFLQVHFGLAALVLGWVSTLHLPAADCYRFIGNEKDCTDEFGVLLWSADPCDLANCENDTAKLVYPNAAWDEVSSLGAGQYYEQESITNTECSVEKGCWLIITPEENECVVASDDWLDGQGIVTYSLNTDLPCFP